MAETEQQLHAIERARTTTHHLAVRARAGTGKTYTIKKMVEAIPKRQKSVIVMFNKQNADDTRPQVPKHVDVMTAHSLGFRALKRGLNQWTLTPDSTRLRKVVQGVIPGAHPKGVYGAVSKLTQHSMNHLAKTPEEIRGLLRQYGVLPQAGYTDDMYAEWVVDTLKALMLPTNDITFDEMMYQPVMRGIRAGYYDNVLYDEAQDGNPLMRALITSAVSNRGRMIVVFDDRQCIYQFRGASPDDIRGLVNDDLKAEILPLTVTFRCPRIVVDIARGIVDDYVACEDAPEGEVTWVDEEESYGMIRPGHVVIARSNYALTRVCMQLLKRGVRAKVMGREYVEKFNNVIDAFPGTSITAFYDWALDYRKNEGERLVAAGMDEQAKELGEIIDALKELGDGVRNVAMLREKLKALFTDEEAGDGFVLLSSVHRAKGLQWTDVWVMEGTFRLSSEENENLYYVAITRTLWTKDNPGHLRLIQTPNKKGEYPPSIAKRLLEGDV